MQETVANSAIEIVGNDVIKIGIEAKQAFGTGTHETTRLVISELLNIDLHNKRVLDCGVELEFKYHSIETRRRRDCRI